MFSAAKNHMLYRVANSPVRAFPFPHICVEDVFPGAFYAEILRHRLADTAYRPLSETGRVSKGAYEARLCLFPAELDQATMADPQRVFWRRLFTMFDDRECTQLWLDLFRQGIEQRFREELPHLTERRAKISAEMILIRDTPSFALGPHTDSTSKVVSVLIYLPADESRPELGTSIYRPKDRRFTCLGGPHYPYDGFERIATMPYRPNTLVAFAKNSRSFHGVEPVIDAAARRDILLYDLRVELGQA